MPGAPRIRRDAIHARAQRHQLAVGECRHRRSHVNQPTVERQHRRRVLLLRFDRRRQRILLQRLPRGRTRKPVGVSARPLHRSAQPLVRLGADHADLFAVVDERHARHRQQEKGRDPRLRQVAAQLGARPRLVVVAQERRPAVVRHRRLKTQHRRQQPTRRPASHRADDAVGHLERKVRIELVRIVRQYGVDVVVHFADGERIPA